jgi:hypothetical protein
VVSPLPIDIWFCGRYSDNISILSSYNKGGANPITFDEFEELSF